MRDRLAATAASLIAVYLIALAGGYALYLVLEDAAQAACERRLAREVSRETVASVCRKGAPR